MDLACDRRGKTLHELHVTWRFEVGQACAAEVANLVLGDGGTGSKFHPGGDLFAELAVGDADEWRKKFPWPEKILTERESEWLSTIPKELEGLRIES